MNEKNHDLSGTLIRDIEQLPVSENTMALIKALDALIDKNRITNIKTTFNFMVNNL